MMELPGSFSGMWSSPMPHRGPLASQRMSLAIFMRLAAKAFRAPWANTRASLLVRAWNLLASGVKSAPVISRSRRHTTSSYPSGALRPVPTAVPPMASFCNSGKAVRSIRQGASTSSRQPETSWANRRGVASCRWVRPMRIRSGYPSSSFRKAAASRSAAGSTCSVMLKAAAMWRAEGKVSLLDWEAFTWSLGWSWTPRSAARWAMTSLTFMLVWVPLPVCHTTRGNSSSHFPARISRHTAEMAPACSAVSLPQSALARAQASFSQAKAVMISRGWRWPPIWKFSRLRWV